MAEHEHRWSMAATETKTVFYTVEGDEDGGWTASYDSSDDEDTVDVQQPRCGICGEVLDIDPDEIIYM